METKKFYAVSYKGIKKETEKAVRITCGVSWGNGGSHDKDIWLPKSQVDEIDRKQGLAYVARWFIEKLEAQNAFHGYDMTIEKTTE